MAEGLTNEEIANRLRLSEQTVKSQNHLYRGNRRSSDEPSVDISTIWTDTAKRNMGTAWKRCRMLALLTDLLLACMMLAPGYAGKLSAPCGVEA